MDELAWLRPVEINFDETFAAMNEKIKSGEPIEDNPEIAELMSQGEFQKCEYFRKNFNNYDFFSQFLEQFFGRIL